ncbi:winged helix-turn-helix domain-containing protein [Streptacidiphilus neutrinimicus]|uniref:winged helix-turn-helix domain-containing protein n=1 Tax=Streptacidiphilus neutrinimicus TaxID=105420 RepID=UPI0006946FDB
MSISYPRAERQHRRIARRGPHTLAAFSAPAATPQPPHGIVVDPARRSASAAARPLRLTRLEFDLLAHLVSQPLRVFTRSQLLEAVWDLAAVGDGRTVDVHVTRLRRKLGPAHRQMIATVRGVGYTYDPTAC